MLIELLQLRADLAAVQADRAALKVKVLAVANGCHDYNGGHRDRDAETFHHGISTVIRALTAALTGDPNDTQVAALERIGRAAPVARAGQRGGKEVIL